MDQKIMEEALKWTKEPFDPVTREEIKKLIDDNNEKELIDRFYKGLEFGTGGLRGIIGAGLNRMNVYTVRRATQGLANYILKNTDNGKDKGVVISYDSRNYSDVFAKEAARVLAANGIKVYIFSDIRPLPEMSFAVRYLKTQAGIMITASHNPPEYNGYKVSWEDGAQVIPPHDKGIIEEVNKVEDFFKDVKIIDFEEGLNSGIITYIDEEVDNAYIKEIENRIVNKQVVESVAENLNVVYTPLHGTGIKMVPKVLSNLGIKNLHIVEEQKEPNGDFPTVSYPNPEEAEALSLGIKLAKEVASDIVMATDPDADRLGIAVRDLKTGEFNLLTGNQLGSLMVYYVLSNYQKQGKLRPGYHVIIKSIVTTELARKIAESFGVETIDVLTGFKYIGAKIREFEEAGNNDKFVFGFEESYGFLLGDYVRDKDAVIATQLTAELAAYAYSENKTLLDLLNELYLKYGFFLEKLKSYTFKGFEGAQKIQNIMKGLREYKDDTIGVYKILERWDILESKIYDSEGNEIGAIDLPKSNVLIFKLENNLKFIARPSGTEPKIKFYFMVSSEIEGSLESTKEKVSDILDSLISQIDKLVEDF